MRTSRIVLITLTRDQDDILEEFLEWHLGLGIDLVLAHDQGSTDGSRQLLRAYSRRNPVDCQPLSDSEDDSPPSLDALAAVARERYGADWIIQCGANEFLCTHGRDLRSVLDEADQDGVTLLELPRRNMTGPLPRPGQQATGTLTLRIDQQMPLTPEHIAVGDMPFPFIRMKLNGRLAVRADGLDEYGPGGQAATTTWGEHRISDDLYLVQYPCRTYEKLQQEVANGAAWFAAHPELPPTWGWTLRRLVRLQEEGHLREEYERQFVTPERAEALLRDGTCVRDESVAVWTAQRAEEASRRRGLAGVRHRLSEAVGPGAGRRKTARDLVVPPPKPVRPSPLEIGADDVIDGLLVEPPLPVYDSSQAPSVWRLEAVELWRYRDLVTQLVTRDIKVRYKRSVLGIAWTMLNPLLMMIVYTVAFNQIFQVKSPNYPVFLLTGLLSWGFFAQTSVVAMHELLGGGPLLTRIYVPRTVFTVSAAIVGVVNLLLSLVPLLALMLATGAPFSLALAWLPVSILVLATFTLGVSLVVSALAVQFFDVVEIYQVLLQAWFFLTPVIYPPDMIPEDQAWRSMFNPMFHMIAIFRGPIYEGQPPDPVSLATAAASAIVLLVVGWVFFTLRSDQLAYRL